MKLFSNKEYEKFTKKLVRLSLVQLEQIAKKTGLVFSEKEKNKLITEDYILALAESDKDELINAYNDVTELG